MKITKKENKQAFEAIQFCVKATDKAKDSRWPFHILQIENKRICGTDSHRAHYQQIDLPDGSYEWDKSNNTFDLKQVHSRYPDIDAAIPTIFKHVVQVDRQELIGLCKQAKIINDNLYKMSFLTFNGGLDINTDNPDIGTYRCRIETSHHINPEVTIGINMRFVLDALTHFKGEKVTVKLTDTPDIQPLVLQSMDQIKTALIMPMDKD